MMLLSAMDMILTADSVMLLLKPSANRRAEVARTTASSRHGLRVRLGPLLVGATSKAICLLEFTDRRMLDAQFAVLRRHFKNAIVPGENEHIVQLRKELEEYFLGSRKQFTVKLVFPGIPVSGTRVERASQDPLWKDSLLRSDRQTHWFTDCPKGCRSRKWTEPHRDRHPLSPCREQKRSAWRIWRRAVAKTKAACAGKRNKHHVAGG